MIDPVGGEPRELDQGRQIRFAVTPTGVRVAYATVGRGPALVVPAAWVGHLEIAWQDPAVRAYLEHFWTHWSGPDYLPDPAELDRLADAYARPGAFTASINWYRAGAGSVATSAAPSSTTRRSPSAAASAAASCTSRWAPPW